MGYTEVLVLGELDAGFESETLGDEVVEDEFKGAFGEEGGGGDVGVVGTADSEGEGVLGEAVGGDLFEGGGEDGGFGIAVGRGLGVFVGVVEASLGLEEERAETRWGAEEGVE